MNISRSPAREGLVHAHHRVGDRQGDQGVPAYERRVRRWSTACRRGSTTTDVNLGIAIDVEKKDGSRTLLVPNIKGAHTMDFAQFLDAYNDRVKQGARRQARDRRFSGHDHLAHESRHHRHRRLESASDGRPERDHRHRRDRISGRISGDDRRRLCRSSASARRSRSRSTYDHRVIQGAESGLFLARSTSC